MSHRRNQLRNDPPFAEEFKPARILGAASINEMRNNIFIELQNERFNDNRDRLLYLDAPTKIDNDTRSVFTLRTSDSSIKPIVHPVEVVDLREKYDHAYAVETESGVKGITVVLIKETKNKDSEIYANIYFLPFSTLSQILSNCSSTPIGVEVKQDARIKLQITIRPTATGEPSFRTHDTEVNLEGISVDEVKLKNTLQFEVSKEVAHIVSQLIKIEPIEELSHKTRLHPQLFSARLELHSPSSVFWDKILPVVSVTASVVTFASATTIIAGGTGVIATIAYYTGFGAGGITALTEIADFFKKFSDIVRRRGFVYTNEFYRFELSPNIDIEQQGQIGERTIKLIER